jgi:hypothetical protein
MGVNTKNAIGLGTLPASIPIPDAFYFDSKMDDGVALTGNVLSANSSNPTENEPQFVLTTEGSHRFFMEYNFASTDKCTLMMGMDF